MEADTGLTILKLRGKGYKLERPLLLLDEAFLQRSHDELGWNCHVLTTIDSTNAEAFRELNRSEHRPQLYMAEQQTAGRGRRGRFWSSPFGLNIYYTLMLPFVAGIQGLSGLSLTVGLAVADLLEDIGVAEVSLKWPNDVHVQGEKVAGILLEMRGDPADICYVAIGVGLNVNMLDSFDQLSCEWTSLARLNGREFDRNTLICALSRKLHSYLARHASSGFSSLREYWESYSSWTGREVLLQCGEDVFAGVMLGLGDDGSLRLSTPEGERAFTGGEVSLRLLS